MPCFLDFPAFYTHTTKGCVAMPLPHKNSEYTIDDIYALPDGQRA